MLLIALSGAVLPSKALAEEVSVDSWSDLYSALQSDGNSIKLTDDVTFGSGGGYGSSVLHVPNGASVTLDLNGHIIDRGLTGYANNGYVIEVDGSLVIKDSNPTATHNPAVTYVDPNDADNTVTVNGGIITGGYYSRGGGIYVYSGNLTLESGSIACNTSAGSGGYGGGIYMENAGSFTMAGGSICGNTVVNDGAGVYATGNSTIEITGGTICGNKSTDSGCSGGGIFAIGGSTLTLSNASISGNRAGNGGGVFSDSTFKMKGGTINDNVAYNDSGHGGGVRMNGNFTFTMEGGTITNNTCTGSRSGEGGVQASTRYDGTASFLMSGGEISGNTAASTGGVGVGYTAFTMSGDAAIKNNKATNGDGGGLQASYGTIILKDNAIISGNSATGSGAGIMAWYGSIDASGNAAITDNVASVDGGGIADNGQCAITLGGNASISNNEATRNGGGVCGVITLSGDAKVLGNKAGGTGGGLHLGGTYTNATIAGGEISGNTSAGNGGGVFVPNDCNLTLTGGKIVNNTVTGENCYGGGIYSTHSGCIGVSGAPEVKENTAGGVANNVYLLKPYNWMDGDRINVVGALAEGASIGVTTVQLNQGAQSAPITSGYSTYNDADDPARFFFGDGGYVAYRDGDEAVLMSPWQHLNMLLDAGGTIQLDRDYTAMANDVALSVPGGITATLDLNGHVLDRALAEAKENGFVILVNASGNLTVIDSAPETTHDPARSFTDPVANETVAVKGGLITGGYNTGDGGGIFVQRSYSNHGFLTLNGGTIAGNVAQGNGGGMSARGTMTMSGGCIGYNTSNAAGGGVYPGNGSGIFTMTGGSIVGNTAATQGGGVRSDFETGSWIDVQGGTITHNVAADGGGVYLGCAYNSPAYQFSGAPVITGNKAGGVDSNVRVPVNENGRFLTVGAALEEGASIGITSPVAPASGSSVQFTDGYATYNGGTDPAQFFTSDAGHRVKVNASGEAELRISAWKELQAQLALGGDIQLTEDVKAAADDTALVVPAGVTATLDLNGHVIDRGLTGATNWGQVFVLNGGASLTLKDSNPTAEHGSDYTYTDPRNAENVITVTGGIITGGNVARRSSSNNPYGGGGVLVEESATFIMQGGTLCGNSSTNNGSAVYVLKNGAFSMSGDAALCGNKAVYHSSASNQTTVHLLGATFAMSDNASITGNTGNVVNAEYAGSSSSYVGPSVTLSGNAAISGNTGFGVYIEGTSSAPGIFGMSDNARVSDNSGYGISAAYCTLTMEDAATVSNNTLGGVRHFNGSAIITDNVTISGNGDESTNGGGIYAGSGSSVALSGNVTIKENAAACGGGIYAYSSANVAIGGNVAIKDNTASGGLNKGLGGGLYMTNNYSSYPVVTVTDNVTISGNSANGVANTTNSGLGGGVYLDRGTFSLSSGTITNNTAMKAGGGVLWTSYSGTAFQVSGNPVIAGNKVGDADDNASPYVDFYAGTGTYQRDCKITIVDSLTEGASIGVTYGVPAQDSPIILTSGYDTYNRGVNPTTFFSSDEQVCKVDLNESGEVRLATPETYSLWIAGTQVTEMNCDDVFGDGKVSYDPAENVLTLDGYDSGTDPGFHVYGVLYSEIPDLTISVASDSVIRASKSDTSYNAQTALVVKASTKLEIAEGVTLDLYGPDSNDAYYCRVIEIPNYDSTLAITGAGTLNVVGTPYCGWAVRGEGGLSIDGPDVTVSVVPNVNSSTYTICLYDTSATVNSGTLTLVAPGQNQYVIYSDGYASSSVTAAEGLAIYLGSGPDDLEKQSGQQCSGSRQGYLKVCEPYTYDLWVAGVQVTKTNAADLTVIDGVDVAAGGKLSFDPASNTLAMKDVSIVNGRTEGSGIRNYAGIYSEIPLNITVEGTCSATARDCETSAWCAGVFAHYIGNSGEEADSLSISLAPGAVLTAKGGTGDVMCKSIGVHSNRKLAISGTGTLNALGNAVEGYGSESRGISAGDSIGISGSPTIVATGDSATRGYRSVGVLVEDGSNDEASLIIGGGTLMAKGIGDCIYCYGIANEFARGSVVVSDGKVIASAGTGSSESFGVKAYSSSIADGSLEAKSEEDGYQHRALSTVPTISEGILAGASVNANGSDAVAYVADNNDTYNWFKAPYTHTVSFAAGAGSGEMAPVEVAHGERFALPKSTFTAPKCKAFDKWDKGAVGAEITVTADVTLTAQWKDSHSLEKVNAVAATCEKGGTEAYWKCSVCGKMFGDSAGTKQIDKPAATKALGHSWGAATYAWSSDLKTCTATRTCTRDASHVESEKATATSKVTKEPTTQAEGVRTYTATFANKAFATQTRTESIPKLEPTPDPEIDKALLEDAVGAAQEALALQYVVESADGTDVPRARAWATPEAKKALADALAAAEKVLADKGATQAQVDAAQEALDKALEAFGPRPGTAVATWKRLAGDSAFKTMSAIIDEGGFEAGGTVVLASLEGYWDALTAAGVAGLEKAPVVMSTPEGLSPEAKAQLQRLAPKKIVVCGGTYWLPDALLSEAAAAAGTKPEVVRLAGDNAALTAGQIAAYGKGRWSDTAIVATAGTFQDALAAAPVSWAKAMPIFLAQFDFAAEKGYITPETIAAMKDAGITKCYIAGGTYWLPKGVSDDLAKAGIEVVDQLMGDTAVETSAAIAAMATSKLGMEPDRMGVANVAQHYDALASASFCGKANSVLLLARDENSSMIGGFVKSNGPKVAFGYVFGGTGSVSDATMAALEAATK